MLESGLTNLANQHLHLKETIRYMIIYPNIIMQLNCERYHFSVGSL